MRVQLLVFAFCVGFSINAYSQGPFPCDARFYQVFGFEGELAAYNLETDQFAFAPNDAGVRLNAAGRNPLDGFAYMLDIDNLHLLRMASDGSVTSLGPVVGLPVNNYSGGDFWIDGLLYVNPGSNGGIFNTFYGINVNSRTVENVVDVQGALFAIPDIAHNIVDDLMYAVTSESPFGGSEVPAGNLIAINLETATFEVIGLTGVPEDAGIASTYADASNRVYGSDRFGAILYEFDIETAQATAIGRSILLPPNTGPIDGFYCPQSPGPFPPASTVPTLSEWGLIAMAGLLGIVGFIVATRKKVIA